MKLQLTKIVTGLALAGTLISGTAIASAIESSTTFDGIANRFQQARYFTHQNKTTDKPSQIRFTQIGGGYSMNVKSQHGTGTQYAETRGIVAGVTQNITNKTPRGQRTRLIVTNNTWVTVTVSIAGWYKTN